MAARVGGVKMAGVKLAARVAGVKLAGFKLAGRQAGRLPAMLYPTG